MNEERARGRESKLQALFDRRPLEICRFSRRTKNARFCDMREKEWKDSRRKSSEK